MTTTKLNERAARQFRARRQITEQAEEAMAALPDALATATDRLLAAPPVKEMGSLTAAKHVDDLSELLEAVAEAKKALRDYALMKHVEGR